MTTALGIITRSMRILRTLGVGETPTASEADEGLTALNSMLDQWWNENCTIYRQNQENFPINAGDGDYTIGAGGDFNTTRPLNIFGGFVRYQSIDYPLNMITREEYDAIWLKGTSIQTIPSQLFYDPAFPLATIYLWPIPYAPMTLFIDSPQRLQSFAGLATDVALPPGYEDALVYGLAVRRAPEFGMSASPDVLGMAREYKAVVKRKNWSQPTVPVDSALLPPGASMNYHIPPT